MPLLPTDPKAQAKIAVGVVAVAAAAYYYTYPYTAAAAELEQRTARVERLEEANAKARREAARGTNPKELKAEAARSRTSLEMLRRLVPTEHEVPALLEQVSTAARRAGLEIGGVAPEPVLAGADFDTYRYKLTVGGGYHALATFLANVGSLPRIVAPVTFELTPKMGNGPAPRGAAAAPVTTLQALVTVQTYVAHVGSPAATTAAGGSHGAVQHVARGGDVEPATPETLR